MRRDQKTLLAAAVLSLVLWAVPGLRMVALPLIYLNTHIHELCHAVVALATGGHVQMIAVFANGSGVTPISGGSVLLAASAGYVGSAVVGGLTVAGARQPKSAKSVLYTLCVCLGLSMLLFVRGDAVGIISGLFWTALLWILAKKLAGDHAVFAAQFLGVQLALTSLQSLLVLLQVSTGMEAMSDARILESVTGLPAIVWAVGWSLLGLLAIGGSLATAWKPASRKRSAS